VPQGLFYSAHSANEYSRIIGASTESTKQNSRIEPKIQEPEWPKTLLPPPTLASLYWYYSEASLFETATFSICREPDTNRPIGALIIYLDNTIAVLGQWYENNMNITRYAVTASNVLEWVERDGNLVDLRITNNEAVRDKMYSASFLGTLVWHFSLSSVSLIRHVPSPSGRI